jgi:hypothetical protein
VAVRVTAQFKLRNGDVGPVSIHVRSDKNGNFGPTALAIPSASLDNHTDTADAFVSGKSVASTTIKLRQLTPTIAVAPASGQAGAKVTVSGSGYAANLNVTVHFGGRQVGSAKTDSSGSFSMSFTVPTGMSSGNVTVKADSAPGWAAQSTFDLLASPPRYSPTLVVYPTTTIPGAQIFLTGTDFPPNTTATISGSFHLTSGKIGVVRVSASTGAKGTFDHVAMNVPANAATATDPVKASASGFVGSASLTVQRLKPTIVLSPAVAVPGTKITVQGFGFAANTKATVSFNGTRVATATTNGAGKFTATFLTSQALATGRYTVSAVGSGGDSAATGLRVQRQIQTTYYFAEGNTSYAYGLYLALFNPGNINGKVTVRYYNNKGANFAKTYSLPAHTRETLNIRKQTSPNRGVAMLVTADVPIAAERIIYHGASADSTPGATALHTGWYFAEGNTTKGYTEWIPMLNPGNQPATVKVSLLTTHHGNKEVDLTLGAHSRYSMEVNRYIQPDAVGVIVQSSQPIVAERTVYYTNGKHTEITSKVGVNGYNNNWYFPAGSTASGTTEWISADNPSSNAAHITLYSYNALGDQVAKTQETIAPYHRVGYKMNQIVPNTDLAVALKSDVPVLSERLMYLSGGHAALTDDFGVHTPGTAWWFANGDTRANDGYTDGLAIFNPNMGPAPVIVRLMTSSGKVINVSYLIPPTTKEHINLNAVVHNAQFGVVVNADEPVAVEQYILFNRRLGGMTTHGIPAF